MKPRLRFSCGLWTCSTIVKDKLYVGAGMTPVRAYYEWQFIKKEK